MEKYWTKHLCYEPYSARMVVCNKAFLDTVNLQIKKKIIKTYGELWDMLGMEPVPGYEDQPIDPGSYKGIINLEN